MKTVCSQSIDVRVPVGPVFAFTADVTRWPLWFSFVVSAQQPDRHELQFGEEVHLCMREGRRRWQEDFEVTRYVRNAFLWLEGALSASRRIELRFEQRTDCTRVVCSIAYPVFGGWLSQAGDTLLRKPRLAAELRNSLSHLKSVVEDAHQAVEAESLGAREPLFV